MNSGCGKIAKHVIPMILRRYRDAAGLSQQQLADYGEVNKGFISALEGGHSVPNVDMLITLARAFGVRPGELLDAVVDETEKRNAATVKAAS